VLSSQRADAHEVLFDVEKSKTRAQEESVNPLVENGRKLVPSVTRVFNTDKEMFVYLQAYRGADNNKPDTQPLMSYVTLYSDGVKRFETPMLAAHPDPSNRIGITPLSFHFALKDLPAGRYDCQITVLDPVTSKVAFWRAPVVLVP
jgi:hypothetical protein